MFILADVGQFRIPHPFIDRAVRGRDALVNLPPEAWILVRKPRPQIVRRVAGQFGGFAMGVTEALVLPDARLDTRLAPTRRQQAADETDQLRLDSQGERQQREDLLDECLGFRLRERGSVGVGALVSQGMIVQ